MTENIIVVTRALEFLWMFCRGAHMFTGSLPEDNHTKCSHIARLGNN